MKTAKVARAHARKGRRRRPRLAPRMTAHRGRSSPGRARASQARGSGFESRRPLRADQRSRSGGAGGPVLQRGDPAAASRLVDRLAAEAGQVAGDRSRDPLRAVGGRGGQVEQRRPRSPRRAASIAELGRRRPRSTPGRVITLLSRSARGRYRAGKPGIDGAWPHAPSPRVPAASVSGSRAAANGWRSGCG